MAVAELAWQHGFSPASCYARRARYGGIPAADARNAITAIGGRLPQIPPEQDVALLRKAGFENVELFCAASKSKR